MKSVNDYEMDANKAKVYSKLDELKKVLNNAEKASDYNRQTKEDDYSLKSYSSSKDIDRLQAAMHQMQATEPEDPETTQLNAMLDKIQAIQNPDKPDYTIKRSDDKSLPIRKRDTGIDISLLKSNDTMSKTHDTVIQTDQRNAFYGLADNDSTHETAYNNSVECIVPETQIIVTGSTVKLALNGDITIDNVSLPSGTLIYGTASISNERLGINITSIRYQNSILPVSLSVYDMDGQQGIFIPGSINRTVAKESANKVISGIDPTIVDPSIGAQAASAGIEAAKSLAGKKVKLIKVTVKSGYKVLLRNSKDK